MNKTLLYILGGGFVIYLLTRKKDSIGEIGATPYRKKIVYPTYDMPKLKYFIYDLKKNKILEGYPFKYMADYYFKDSGYHYDDGNKRYKIISLIQAQQLGLEKQLKKIIYIE